MLIFLEDQKTLQRETVTPETMGLGKCSANRKGRKAEPLARKAGRERKIRHQSRVEKLAVMPKVKDGRPLNDDREDERAWMDW